MRRRQVLALLGVTLVPTAGCTLERGSISIAVQNFTPDPARVRLRLTSGDAERYATTVELSGDEKRYLENVVAGGDYGLTVSTDRFGDASRPVTMNGCAHQEVSVAILPSEDVDVQLKRC